MKKETKNTSPDSYSEVVAQLQAVVEALEGGDLSLEASLERFGEGVSLVKHGEKLLTDAEAKIEQLLNAEGATTKLDVSGAAESKPKAGVAARNKRPAVDEDEDSDVPF